MSLRPLLLLVLVLVPFAFADGPADNIPEKVRPIPPAGIEVSKADRAEVDPEHLIFTIWAATQHYADFAVQVQALTGKTLADPVFFEHTVLNVQRIVLKGVLPT